jgi:hypothetical protein
MITQETDRQTGYRQNTRKKPVMLSKSSTTHAYASSQLHDQASTLTVSRATTAFTWHKWARYRDGVGRQVHERQGLPARLRTRT